MRGRIPDGEVLLFPRVKDGLLRKVECYTNERDFNWQVQGKVDAINWKNTAVIKM